MRPLSSTPVLLRAVILLAGGLLTAIPSSLNLATCTLTGVGVLLTAAWPAREGLAVATGGFLLSWLASTGLHADPSLMRTAVAAAALYVLFSAVGLAPFVPLRAEVDPCVVIRHLTRCVPRLLVATALVAADYAMSNRRGSPLLELGGLAGVLVLLAAAAWCMYRQGARRTGQR